MKRFRFRLERLLAWRAREEAMARRRSALASAELERARSAVAAAESFERDLQAEAGPLVLTGRAGVLGLQQALLAGAGTTAARWREQAGRREKEREAALEAWNGARARTRSLERFRERAWTRHRLEAARQDAKEMDQIARAGFVAAGRET